MEDKNTYIQSAYISSSDYETRFHEKPQQSLRTRLIQAYPKTIHFHHLTPSEISLGKFTFHLNQWLQYANIPIAKKEGKGLWYAEDYVGMYGADEECMQINGLAHPSFWDTGTQGCLFKANDGHTPNQMLCAFFAGPTFAECGSVMQACIYRAIEEMIGTREFNRTFGPSLIRFLITPILFDKIYTAEEKPEYSLDFRSKSGNPIHFLFDRLEEPSETHIQKGDIVYIKGVDRYTKKHLVGPAAGWNVLCIGKNESQENLYVGFGPDIFSDRPLTYKEIKSVLIKLYNSEQLQDTRSRIKKFKTLGGFSPNNMMKKDLAEMAESLANDQVDDNYSIAGIEKVIRFNPTKLKYFIDQELSSWHEASFETLKKEKDPKAAHYPAEKVTIFPAQYNCGKLFRDFDNVTPAQCQMLTATKKFSLAVCCDKKEPIGLFMTGKHGIGKTHLSVALTKYVEQRGKKVAFMNSEKIKNLYQKAAKQQHSFGENMDEVLNDYLKNSDLIILDSLDSKCRMSDDFLKKSLHYIVKTCKAIMVTANQPLHSIQEDLPDYISYDDNARNNFLFMQDIDEKNYLNTWWPESILNLGIIRNNQDALDILSKIDTEEDTENQAAGLILEEDNANLMQISKQYLEYSLDKNIKIRILPAPAYHQKLKIFDLPIQNFDQYDVFFIKVNCVSECEQLLQLIPHVSHTLKKLIVVTDDESNFNTVLETQLSSKQYEANHKQLRSMVNNLLLKSSYWDNKRIAPEYS